MSFTVSITQFPDDTDRYLNNLFCVCILILETKYIKTYLKNVVSYIQCFI